MCLGCNQREGVVKDLIQSEMYDDEGRWMMLFEDGSWVYLPEGDEPPDRWESSDLIGSHIVYETDSENALVPIWPGDYWPEDDK